MTDPDKCAQRLMDQAKDSLARTGHFHPSAMLIAADRTRLIGIDGTMMHSRAEKRGLVEFMRQQCREMRAEATVFVSDTYWADMTLEQDEKRRLVGEMLGQPLNIEQTEAAGLCIKHEGIMVVIETKDKSRVLRQEYRRINDPRRGRRIEFVGECISVGPEESAQVSGVMTGWLE